MIIIIAKELVNGRWADVDGNKLYRVNQVVLFCNGVEYKVTAIVGSKITLELVVQANE